MTEPFCPALAEVFPTLVDQGTSECSRCSTSRTTGSPQDRRPVVVDILPLLHSGNLKLQDLFEFGKWEEIHQDEGLRDACEHYGQGHQRRQTTPQAWPDRLIVQIERFEFVAEWCRGVEEGHGQLPIPYRRVCWWREVPYSNSCLPPRLGGGFGPLLRIDTGGNEFGVGDGDIERGDADADANVVRKKAEAEAKKKAKKKADAAAAKRTVVPDSDDPDPATDLNQPKRPTRIARARGAHLTVNTGITAQITTAPTAAPPRTPATPAFESELARRMRQMSVTPDPNVDDRRPAYLQPNPNSVAMRQGSWRRGDQPARTPLASVFAGKKLPVQIKCVS
jgi:hypothetical protein